MAFDSQTRNKLQRMVGACRRLLADEFDDQLQGLYGIYAQDGRVLELEKLTSLDDDHHQTATLLRDRIKHLTSGMASEKQPLAEAVRRVLREQAFTLLNRFAALRMAEERGFVQECVGQGLKSKGFQVFETVARSGLGGAYERYVTFIHGMFDELSLDLGVLFDRWSPFGLLFPREPALLKFFELLNDPELKPLWKEDETIGWIYQYFNDEAERKKMREESSAPRNSRELAVRNQFFTPRYVVEFLTDNTLGRIWYEMSGGATSLKEKCRYLVRRPNEIFLKPGETAPASDPGSSRGNEVQISPSANDESLVTSAATNTPSAAKASPSPPSEGGEGRGEVGLHSTLNSQPSTAPTQEELLKQPVHIPHRPIKDPRTILMLDPACGSMHFGLYAFDLFEVIYDEAWELVESMRDELRGMKPEEITARYPLFSSFITHTSSFKSKEEFLRQVPRLIIEHNLHGIDIDPRCAQIAGLSLWLRAQKAWQRLGLKPAERPAIKRSNIVCAEPMPGEKELLREFVEREFPAEERGVCLRLLEAIFDKMQLAGEAGSLLKIEEEIRSAIEDARRQWQTARQRPEFFDADQLAALDTRAGAQQELPAAERAAMAADLRSLTSEDFWERIEERIYAALRDYSEQAENGGGFQRRLFAEDAARGFAFIDVCRKRYDVALMNPPFGAFAASSESYMNSCYTEHGDNLATCFLLREMDTILSGGFCGAIVDHSLFVKSSFADFRESIGAEHECVKYAVHLGWGILDTANVEASTIILGAPRSAAFMVTSSCANEPKNELAEFCASLNSEASIVPRNSLLLTPALLKRIPHHCFSSSQDSKLHATSKRLAEQYAITKQGLAPVDTFRFVRLRWEIEPRSYGDTGRWLSLNRGGDYAPFYREHYCVINWASDGRELKHKVLENYPYLDGNWGWVIKNEDFYKQPGLCYGKRADLLNVQIMPAGMLFTNEGFGIFTHSGVSRWLVLGLLNSVCLGNLLNTFCGQHKFSGYVDALPVPPLTPEETEELAIRAEQTFRTVRESYVCNENSVLFVSSMSSSAASLEAALAGFAARIGKVDDSITSTKLYADQLVIGKWGNIEARLDRKREWITDAPAFADGIASFALGTAFGRWDIRYATGEQATPELPDPFAPLPVCPPGQLQNAQGLPARPADVPAAYPVRIPWDGILVDDPNHPLDIERRVREVIEIIWGGSQKSEVRGQRSEGNAATAERIEHEACEILGVKSLRDYFRKPAGFFADHLKRYSKSRRQAPIYWPLSTASGSYTLWIYYHRLTDQTLFQCVNDFVKPKLEEIMKDELRIMKELQNTGAGSVHNSSLITHNSKSLREKLEELSDFKQELQDFQAELLRVAGLPYKPNLNDGVLITASPLWKLFRLPTWQKDLKACWEALEKEEYEWAHLAYTIWPDRVKKVCKTDRSIAIAHGLEELCDVKAPEKKAKRGKKKAEAELEMER